MPSRQQHLDEAADHLQRHCRVMRSVITSVGPCRLPRDSNRFRMLVRSIIGQQLSGKAAGTIRKRFETLLESSSYQVDEVGALSVTQMRSKGLSERKATYIQELARHVSSDQLRLSRIGRLDDEGVITELTQVKGVGRWTAHMFLIFSLGRLDVLPHGDLGVRAAIRNLYELDELPEPAAMDQIAAPWRPYASVAAWYCWQSLDNE